MSLSRGQASYLLERHSIAPHGGRYQTRARKSGAQHERDSMTTVITRRALSVHALCRAAGAGDDSIRPYSDQPVPEVEYAALVVLSSIAPQRGRVVVHSPPIPGIKCGLATLTSLVLLSCL